MSQGNIFGTATVFRKEGGKKNSNVKKAILAVRFQYQPFKIKEQGFIWFIDS